MQMMGNTQLTNTRRLQFILQHRRLVHNEAKLEQRDAGSYSKRCHASPHLKASCCVQVWYRHGDKSKESLQRDNARQYSQQDV
ncbi:hypothetical protein TNCV_4982251 [Trichonephila clavipes]|nr:hypothetical protein TNCV_4982251 [Trichonephila clavipes]